MKSSIRARLFHQSDSLNGSRVDSVADGLIIIKSEIWPGQLFLPDRNHEALLLPRGGNAPRHRQTAQSPGAKFRCRRPGAPGAAVPCEFARSGDLT